MSRIPARTVSLLVKLGGLLEPLSPTVSGLVDKFLGYPPRVAITVRHISESSPAGDRIAIELSVTNNEDRPLVLKAAGLRSADKANISVRGDYFIWSNMAEPVPAGTSHRLRLYRDKVTNPAFLAMFGEDWQKHFRSAWVIDARDKRHSSKIPPNVAER